MLVPSHSLNTVFVAVILIAIIMLLVDQVMILLCCLNKTYGAVFGYVQCDFSYISLMFLLNSCLHKLKRSLKSFKLILKIDKVKNLKFFAVLRGFGSKQNSFSRNICFIIEFVSFVFT